MSTSIRALYETFNIFESDNNSVCVDFLESHNFILLFTPNQQQRNFIAHQGLSLTGVPALWEVDDCEITKDIKQACEYFGVAEPAANSGNANCVKVISGLGKDEIVDKIESVLSQNAPIDNVQNALILYREYTPGYPISDIKNNDLRVALSFPDWYISGDDIVRFIVTTFTESSVLIKSKSVLDSLKQVTNPDMILTVLEKNLHLCANVFHRHKPIFMALKGNQILKPVINQISRLSKKHHIPVQPGVSTIMSRAENNSVNFANVSTRDLFKLLNFISKKTFAPSHEIYKIRSGSAFLNKNPKQYSQDFLKESLDQIRVVLRERLAHLADVKILIDPFIDYGLPISEKQTLGRLPFGTKLQVNSGMSCGIHWRNLYGARDLDLSMIMMNGNRIAWNDEKSSDDHNIKFSGDIVDAPDGAMEFITIDTCREYAILAVSIFSGDLNSKCDLVIGRSYDQWIDNTLIKENFTIPSRTSSLGFIKNNTFVVNLSGLSSQQGSWSFNPDTVKAGLVPVWTLSELLNFLFGKDNFVTEGNADIDLKYQSFSFDKLSELCYK